MVPLTCKVSAEFKNIYGVFMAKDIRNMCLTHFHYKLDFFGVSFSLMLFQQYFSSTTVTSCPALLPHKQY